MPGSFGASANSDASSSNSCVRRESQNGPFQKSNFTFAEPEKGEIVLPWGLSVLKQVSLPSRAFAECPQQGRDLRGGVQ